MYNIARNTRNAADRATRTYLYDFSSAVNKTLTDKEKKILYKQIQATNCQEAIHREAINRLVTTNLLFVVSIAKHYHHKPIEEIISDGVIGLIRAAKKYDVSKNVKFLSYAVWWIRQSIIEHAGDNQMIKVPKRVGNKLRKMQKQSNWKEENFNYKAKTAMAAGFKAYKGCYSLDRTTNEDGQSYLDNIKSNDDVQEYVMKTDLQQNYERQIAKMLESFSERDRDIIIHRFALDGEKKVTLEKLGKKHGITKERVRQIQNRLMEIIKEKFDVGV